MQGLSQRVDRQIERGRNPLVWRRMQKSAAALAVKEEVRELDLLSELEEFLRQSNVDAPPVPGREGLLG